MIDNINTLEEAIDEVKNNKDTIQQLKSLVEQKDPDAILIIASGSSYNACQIAKHFIQESLKKPVFVMSPLDYQTNGILLSENSLIIAVSQSGYSSNIINSLKKVKELNLEAYGLTTDLDSPMKDYVKQVFDIGTGVESAGYVTRGVLGLFHLFVEWTSQEKLDYDLINQLINLGRDKFKELYQKDKKQLTALTSINFLGVGVTHSICLEAALKCVETTSIKSYAYEIEEFIHGPNMALTPNDGIFVLSHPKAISRENEIVSILSQITDRTYHIKLDDSFLQRINNVENLYLPYVYLPFIQLLSYTLTEDLGNWKKHPMYYESQKSQISKVEGYTSKEDYKFMSR